MIRAHKSMMRALELLAQTHAVALENEAHKVLAAHKSLSGFSAAMGAACFYSASTGHGLDYEETPSAGKLVLDMEQDYSDAFGSPGIQISARIPKK